MAGNITEFTSAADSLRPSETGIDAIVQGARRAGAFYNEAATTVQQAGDQFARNVGTSIKDVGDTAVNYMAHKDVSQYNVASSALVADKAKAWNQAISGVKNPNWDGKDPNTQWIQKPLDPDDPAASKNFMDGLNGDLDKLKDSMFTEAGQDHAESHNAALRAHFQATTTADISTMAGVAAKAKTVATVNNYSNAAVSDPAGVDNYATLAANAIDNEFANHPGLKGAEGAKLAGEYKAQALKQIYQSGSMSAIQKSSNPEATAAAWSQRYPDYINGAEALTLAKAAKAQVKVNMVADKQLYILNKQITAEKAHTQLSTNWTNNVTFDNSGKAQIKPEFYKNVMGIEMKYPGAATERAKSMIDWGQHEQNEKATPVKDNPDAVSGLYDGLFKADKPTTDVDILKAATKGDLTDRTRTNLLQLHAALESHPLHDPVYVNTMDAVKGIFGEGPLGKQAYANFVQTFLPDYLSKRRTDAGVPQNALDTRDPKSMIGAAIEKYRLTPQQMFRDHLAKSNPGMSGLGDGLTVNPSSSEKPPGLPPLAERKPGQVYQTPIGPKKWSGTGWVNP